MIRTFIAIDLPVPVRAALEGFSKELRRADAPVSWARIESIHLTLKFLGNISEEQVEPVRAELDRIAATTSPFRIQPAGCGAFPTLKTMRVVWVGLRGDLAPLARLQKEVEEAMACLGFKPEDRPFRPHLTVGRVKGRQRLRPLQDLLLANS